MIGGLIRGASRCLLAGTSAAVILASGATAATAADVDQLEAAMKAMQAQMKELQRQVIEAKAQAAAAQSAAASGGGGGEPLDLKVKWKGAPELSSGDGKFKMKVRGRLETDVEHVDQDKKITGVDDINAAELRRARLGVEGVVFYDWKYKFEIDFANDEAAVKDAYLQYAALPFDSSITFGHFKTYNSIEELTSDRFILFMERAAFTEAFTVDRQLGTGLQIKKEHWTASAGVFATAPEAFQADFRESGTTFASRLTLAPINNEKTTLHLGASVRHRDDAGNPRGDLGVGDELFRYRARGADFHLADRFIATPFIGESDTFLGAEAAFIWGPVSFTGEYTQNEVDIAPAISSVSPTYTGWYVDAAWYLTGERRTYEEGEFGRPKVKNPVYGGSHGWGAWQIAGRYDVLDLSDKAAAIPGCTACGEQKTWLLGINWWATDYVRFALNVTQSDIEGGVNDGAEIKGVGARAQIDW